MAHSYGVAGGPRRARRVRALVHAVLAAAPLDADREALGQVARLQGRLLGASESEVAAAAEAAAAGLAHPLFDRVRTSDAMLRVSECAERHARLAGRPT